MLPLFFVAQIRQITRSAEKTIGLFLHTKRDIVSNCSKVMYVINADDNPIKNLVI